jgi:general secretion pathway protein D
MLLVGCATDPKTTHDNGLRTVISPHRHTTNTTPIKGRGQEDKEPHMLFPGTGMLVAPAGTPTSTPLHPGGNITLNFEGADIREVVRTVLGEILRENYVVDPRVGGTITLRTAKPIPKSAALHTLEEVLRMNGAVIVRETDGVYRVVPFALAGKGNTTPQLNQDGKPLPNGFSIQLVPLRYIGVVDMTRILEPLTGEGAGIRADPLRNMLILSGTQLQLQHMIETIDMFDVDWISGMSIGFFTLKNTDAKAVMQELELVFGDKNLGPLAGAVRVVALERLNALLVITPQARYLDEARKWVERIDRTGTGSGGHRLYVYPVQNGRAELLASLLNEVFSKQRAQSPGVTTAALAPGLKPAEIKSSTATGNASPQPIASAAASRESTAIATDVRVIADKDNNALLILANPSDYENIESALRKLDIVPRQVLIEATIAEITLKDELKYGLEWYFNNNAREKFKLDLGDAGIAALVPGFSYSWVSSAGDIGAVLNALAKDNHLKIISSPHITVADNQTAKIQVGDKVPTITQSQTVEGTTAGIINSVQYVETGVMLNVKPHINAGGRVSMEVTQEVSNAIPTDTSSINSPTIQRRAAQSVVTIQSGETLVMAGLIAEAKSRSSEGLPLLSSIPILGGLFGVEGHIDNRTELIVLLTPRVLRNSREAYDITQEYRQRLSGLEDLMKSSRIYREPTSLKVDSNLPKN